MVGKLILGEQLGIYNESGTMTFNENGFEITNGINSFVVDPNSNKLLRISHEDEDLLFVDQNGTLHIQGNGNSLDISGNAVFSNLLDDLENGVTVINGGCIQTGTIDAKNVNVTNINASNITSGQIDADLINAGDLNMRGIISWSDLDSGLQQDIENLEWPDYITETYIDRAEIRSPTITGNNIYANNAFHVNTGGQFGYATGMDANGRTTYGVAMSIEGDPVDYWSSGHYVIVTDGGARMQAGSNSVVVTADGAELNYLNGTYRIRVDNNGCRYYDGSSWSNIGSGSSGGTAVWG